MKKVKVDTSKLGSFDRLNHGEIYDFDGGCFYKNGNLVLHTNRAACSIEKFNMLFRTQLKEVGKTISTKEELKEAEENLRSIRKRLEDIEEDYLFKIGKGITCSELIEKLKIINSEPYDVYFRIERIFGNGIINLCLIDEIERNGKTYKVFKD